MKETAFGMEIFVLFRINGSQMNSSTLWAIPEIRFANTTLLMSSLDVSKKKTTVTAKTINIVVGKKIQVGPKLLKSMHVLDVDECKVSGIGEVLLVLEKSDLLQEYNDSVEKCHDRGTKTDCLNGVTSNDLPVEEPKSEVVPKSEVAPLTANKQKEQSRKRRNRKERSRNSVVIISGDNSTNNQKIIHGDNDNSAPVVIITDDDSNSAPSKTMSFYLLASVLVIFVLA